MAFQVVTQGCGALLQLLGKPLGFGGQVTSGAQPHDEVDDSGVATWLPQLM